MKCVLFCCALATFVSLASSRYLVPDSRTLTYPAYTNYTITTLNYVVGKQTEAYTAMTSTFFSLNLNYFILSCYDTYNWFLFNYLTVQTNLGLINTALTVPFGNTIIVNGYCGKRYITEYTKSVLDTINTAYNYLLAINPTGAAPYSTQITALSTLRDTIITKMSCASNILTLYYSCTDTLITSISQFHYLAVNILSGIVINWCNTVSADISKCTQVTTTTPTTTTTTTTTTTVKKLFF